MTWEALARWWQANETGGLLALSAVAIAGAWLWTLREYRNGNHRAPARWYTGYSPPPFLVLNRWDIQELNAHFVPETHPSALETGVPEREGPPRHPFRVTEPWVHPAGIYPATLVGWESGTDAHELPVVRWFFESRLHDPAGRRSRLQYVTPIRITPLNEMGRLLQACHFPIPAHDAEAERLDPDALIGKQCVIRIRHRVVTGYRRRELVAEIVGIQPLKPMAQPARR